MKILLISTNEVSPWGGSEEYWYEAAKYFQNQNHQVAIFKKDWGEKNHPKVLELIQLGCTNITGHSFDKSLFKNFFSFKRYDLAIMIKGNQLEGLRWMRKFVEYEIPYVTVFQLVTDLQAFSDDLWSELKSYHEKAIMNYFVSNHNMELFQKLFLYQLDNLKITQNPVDETAQSYVPYPKSIIPTIGIVSRLDRFHKGFDRMFVVFHQIQKTINFQINIYGEGLNSRYIRSMSEYYELKNIEFKGHVDDKRVIWAENHALFMLSRMEGLPLSMLEALSSGRCVIGNKESSIDDILQLEPDCGYKIISSDLEKIEYELGEILNDFENWEKKGIKGHSVFNGLEINRRMINDLHEMLRFA